MTMQFSNAVRSARADAIETQIGPNAKLRLYQGTLPASAAAAPTGSTLLVEMPLPSDWMANALNGVKALQGSWNGTGIVNGTIQWFGIFDNAGTTRHIQGTVTSVAVGTGDMLVDNPSVSASQAVVASTFQITDGNQ